MLRANLATTQWNDSFTQPIKECADVETDVCKWMFTEPATFIDKLLTTMLDYPSTRDQLSKMTMVLNKSLPFLMMNDYRLSVGQNRLQRVELHATSTEETQRPRQCCSRLLPCCPLQKQN